MTEAEYDRWLGVMNKYLAHKNKWLDKRHDDGKLICQCTFDDWWPETPYDCELRDKEPSSR